MNSKLIIVVGIFAVSIILVVGFITKTHTTIPEHSVVISPSFHNLGKQQTIFIDQARHDAIQYDDSQSAKVEEDSDTFVVTMPYAGIGAFYELDTARMQCDDLAKWWNSHNNGNNDQVWTEITKLGCQ